MVGRRLRMKMKTKAMASSAPSMAERTRSLIVALMSVVSSDRISRLTPVGRTLRISSILAETASATFTELVPLSLRTEIETPLSPLMRTKLVWSSYPRATRARSPRRIPVPLRVAMTAFAISSTDRKSPVVLSV